MSHGVSRARRARGRAFGCMTDKRRGGISCDNFSWETDQRSLCVKKRVRFFSFSPLRRMWFPPQIIFWRCAIRQPFREKRHLTSVKRGSWGENLKSIALGAHCWSFKKGVKSGTEYLFSSFCQFSDRGFSLATWDSHRRRSSLSLFELFDVSVPAFPKFICCLSYSLSLSLRRCCFDENAAFCESFVDNLVLSLSLSLSSGLECPFVSPRTAFPNQPIWLSLLRPSITAGLNSLVVI